MSQKEIHLLVLAKGYNLSFLKTKELIRYGKNMLAESHLTLFHAPGDAVEFDWGTICLHINDPVKTKRKDDPSPEEPESSLFILCFSTIQLNKLS